MAEPAQWALDRAKAIRVLKPVSGNPDWRVSMQFSEDEAKVIASEIVIASQQGFRNGRDASAKAIEALRDESTRVQPGFNALNRGLAAIRALAPENKS